MIPELQNKTPVLSENIEFNKLKENEYILSNQKHRHYLKINKETYRLLNLINGNRNLIEIQKLFNDSFRKKIGLRQIENLLYNKLSIYGVLKGSEKVIAPYQKPNYLKLSFIVFNEHVISKIVRYFRFLFNVKVALFLIISCVLTMSILGVLNFDIYKSFSIQESLIYFLTLILISSTFHEFGHVAAANYFGAKHGGIGGGFYLFTPVFFADVTDIWRLSKKQRIIVNLSGIYFELIFCSIVALIGSLIDNYTLTLIAIIVCVNTLFNLNPFLRSDGYWVLTDLTNKPNLLHHSFNKVRDFTRILKCKKVKWVTMDYFLFFYGMVSYLIIGGFLYYALFQNSKSVLNFPVNLIKFIKNVFSSNSKINLVEYGELIIPIVFYFLLFRVLKDLIPKIYKKYTPSRARL
jgi:putative peptide zinc metalloprotease protein